MKKYFEIVETRPNKTSLLGKDLNSSLNERADISNKAKADYFISIHTNAFTDPNAKGTETYVIGKGGNAEKLANKVQSNLVNAIGTVNRGKSI